MALLLFRIATFCSILDGYQRIIHHKDESNMFLQNGGSYLQVYTAS